MRTLPSDFLLATTLRAIGDGVISCDRDGNIVLMNAAAQELTGWTEEDAVGQPLKTVFVIVNETTRETVEDPVDKVLSLGTVVGLANHTLLLRRDGSEVPIDDSAAPVRDEAGELRGVVLVFRDVTERRQGEWNVELLSESGKILGEQRDEAAILRQISATVSKHFADFCVFDLLPEEGSRLDRMVGAHRVPAIQPIADRLNKFRPKPAPSAHPATHVFTTEQACLLTDVTDALLENLAESEEHHVLLKKELRPRSLLAVPVCALTQTLGALTFHRHLMAAPFTEADRIVAEELGRRIGLALHYARVREQLRMERARLEAIMEAVPVGLLLSETDGRIVFANEEVEHIFGYPIRYSENTAAHAEYAAFHPDGRRLRGEDFPLPRAIAQNQIIRGERYLFERGDGRRAWVGLSAAPVRTEDGTVVGGVVAISDLDATVRAQERAESAQRQAEQSEARLQALMSRASVGIAVGNAEGGITYANETLLRWIEYTSEELQAGEVRWDRLTPPEYAEDDQYALSQLKDTGVAEPYEKAYIAKSGKKIPLLVGACVIPSESANALTEDIAVFFTDLSLQKRAEATLLQTEKLSAVGRLASSISHEINNPLEAVTNLLYLIRTDEGLTHAGQDYADTAERELARVTQITSQTLRFHRQSTAPAKVKPEDLVEEVLTLYRSRLANSQIVISREYGENTGVTCFEGDIRQVLNNLIGNAFDAMRTGGRLRVRTKSMTWFATGKSGVGIFISDDGPGMPSEVRRRIFEAFYSTKGIHGTGLGLWISKRIIHKHRGHLCVKSWTGERHGTVFMIWLPCELAPTAADSWQDGLS